MRLAPLRTSRHRLLFGMAIAALVFVLAALLWNLHRRNRAADIVIPVAAPLSGPQADEGHAVIDAVDLYFHQVNQTGGVNGRLLRVKPVDDALDPTVARQRASEIVASDALVVLGHLNSVTSVAAAPTYRDGHLAAITASATADNLTDDDPSYFRAVFDNSGEGIALAAYVRTILGYDRATVVYSDEPFGSSLLEAFQSGFRQAGGTVNRALVYDVDPDRAAASVQQIASSLAADPDPGIVVLATTGDTMARDVMVATRRAGAHPQFLGADAVGGDTFPQRFQSIPEEQNQPGYFLEGMYAATPIIFDSADDVAQRFVHDYRHAYGRDPGWREAKYYDAAHVVVDALRKASPRFGRANLGGDRERVRAALASFNSPQAAIDTTTGPLFFNSRRSLSQPVRMGQYIQNHFVSAPVQLEAMTNRAGVNVPAGLAAGTLVQLGDQYAWKQRVVYTGIDVNEISAIDESKGTFTADLYIWFRYAGDDTVLDVEIPNAAGAGFDPKAALATDEVGGLQHRLYRVRGDFKANYDLHEYPFDRQLLTIQLQNIHLSRNQVIYAIDASSREGADPSDDFSNPLRALTSWSLGDVRQYEDTSRTLSTRGYAPAIGSSALSEYSMREVTVTVQRQTSIFLLKTLLPLGLLTLVVLATLFLPVSRADEARTIEVTSLLAAAVLLVAINQRISAGYTIAIEYAFYVFFALCLFCMIVHLLNERLQETRHAASAGRVVVWSRVFYVLVVAALIATYALRFSSRFT